MTRYGVLLLSNATLCAARIAKIDLVPPDAVDSVCIKKS